MAEEGEEGPRPTLTSFKSRGSHDLRSGGQPLRFTKRDLPEQAGKRNRSQELLAWLACERCLRWPERCVYTYGLFDTFQTTGFSWTTHGRAEQAREGGRVNRMQNPQAAACLRRSSLLWAGSKVPPPFDPCPCPALTSSPGHQRPFPADQAGRRGRWGKMGAPHLQGTTERKKGLVGQTTTWPGPPKSHSHVDTETPLEGLMSCAVQTGLHPSERD